MEYYISYHRIIDLFRQYQEQSPRLNSFGHGDIIYFSENFSGTTNVYPYLFVTPVLITYNENTTQYQFSLIFADIVNTDLSNEIDVITDMSIEAKNLMAQIRRGDLQDFLDCTIPAQATTFLERFNDHVGGVELTLVVEVFDDINACVMYPETTTTTTTTNPCPSITTQYVEGEVIGGDKIRATLWSDSGFTISTNAVCDYVFSGTMYGDMGTIYSGTRTFPHNSHQLTWNFEPELEPGESISGFTIDNVVINCDCVELIY
jgi:hypothetical protein